jgi:peptide/nickel transport system substrate-binding protein
VLQAGVLAGVSGTIAAACGGSGDKGSAGQVPAAGGQAMAAPQPKMGGTLTLVGTEPVHWDQHLQATAGNTTRTLTYNNISLVQFDHDNADYRYGSTLVTGQAAAKWERPDPLTIIFSLNPDVRFDQRAPTNGRTLVADDVKYTFDRFYSSSFLKGIEPQPPPKSVEVVDARTVRINLQQPYSLYLTLLAVGNHIIYAHEVEDTFGDFKKAENNRGAGPFILESYVPNSQIVFKRNPDYFRKGRPYVDRVVLALGLNQEAVLSAYRSGQHDIANITPAQLDSVKPALPKATFQETSSCCCPSVLQRVDRAPASDLRVRQAISMALDRPSWIKSLYRGYGEAPYSVFTSLWKEYTIPEDRLSAQAKENYKYDLTKAKALLSAAGLPNGFSADMHLYPESTGTYAQACELLMDFLAKAGIQTKLVTKDYGAYIATTYSGDFDGLGWAPSGSLSPAELMSKWIPDANARNHNHINDPQITGLITKFKEASSDEDAAQIAYQIQNRSAEQLWWNMGVLQHSFHSWQPWVKNYDGRQDSGYNTGTALSRLWIDRG